MDNSFAGAFRQSRIAECGRGAKQRRAAPVLFLGGDLVVVIRDLRLERVDLGLKLGDLRGLGLEGGFPSLENFAVPTHGRRRRLRISVAEIACNAVSSSICSMT